jgi:hypothetical protein
MQQALEDSKLDISVLRQPLGSDFSEKKNEVCGAHIVIQQCFGILPSSFSMAAIRETCCAATTQYSSYTSYLSTVLSKAHVPAS